MGKKGGKQKGQFLTSGHQGGLTLREESSGRKQIKGSSINAKSMLKLQHLQRLATWASGDASIPSFGAFFGHRFAAHGEAIGVPPDPSLFPCQRCESLLQPGFNCTVRIEKNRAKVRRRCKKPNNSPQNNVVYKCHFCSHWNLKRGTPKDHMKEICPQKGKPSSESAPVNPKLHEPANPGKVTRIIVEANNIDEIASPAIASATPPIFTGMKVEANNIDEIASLAIASVTAPPINGPATPLLRTGITLLDAKKRKRNKSASKKPPETDGSSAKIDEEKVVSTSSKRRRKTWTSLKEIAESGQRDSRNISNLTIPFFL